MKKQLSIKDLFQKAWKGFIDNFITWLFLLGAQITIVCGFLLCCVAMLAMMHYVFIEQCLFNCFFIGYSKLFTTSIISIVSIFLLFFHIAFPVMYKQNALDYVFKRPMSGFDVNNRFFSYAVAMFIYWIIVSISTVFGFFPGLFLSQRWRFVGLHLLDHGGSVRDAFHSSWGMTHGYMWFLVGVSLVQLLLFIICSPTVLFILAAIVINRLVDAQIYKILHIEYDRNLSSCSCEA